jgi:hypothetical protein
MQSPRVFGTSAALVDNILAQIYSLDLAMSQLDFNGLAARRIPMVWPKR